MSSLKWLEVLYTVAKNQLVSKEDCIVVVLHCILINKGSKCVGTGDSWDQNSDIPSELLPEGWNSSQDIYTLRYIISPDNKYLMKVVRANDTLLVNVLDVKKSKAAGISVITDNFVADDFSSFSTAYKNLKKLGKDFENDIVKSIKLGDDASDSSKQKTQDGSSKNIPDDPLIEERFSYPYVSTDPQPQLGVPNVGRNDLDPLGGIFGSGGSVGGGMLVDPGSLRGGRPQPPDLGIGGPSLPRGAVPPGARFDPFGPPNRGGNRGLPRSSFPPDPDMMPPGYGDSFI